MIEELTYILDRMEELNMNCLIFHLRANNDAFYQTELAPISGEYGTYETFEEWDYLKWLIKECHKRKIEFHAWLNPYRISSKTTLNDILAKYEDFPANPAHNAENILMTSSGSAILDPGSPDVKEYLVDVCMEIIKKYDVDAIHFDDYFYMEGIDDNETYKQYKNIFASLFTSNIKEEVSLAKIKKYNSSLEASVYHDELDVSVYNNLISLILAFK